MILYVWCVRHVNYISFKSLCDNFWSTSVFKYFKSKHIQDHDRIIHVICDFSKFSIQLYKFFWHIELFCNRIQFRYTLHLIFLSHISHINDGLSTMNYLLKYLPVTMIFRSHRTFLISILRFIKVVFFCPKIRIIIRVPDTVVDLLLATRRMMWYDWVQSPNISHYKVVGIDYITDRSSCIHFS